MKQSNLIWSGNCFGQSRTFLFNPKTNRSKRKVLIWSPYYRNESKTFWFGKKKSFLASRSFPFWLKNSGTEQSSLIWSGSFLGKLERLYLIQKLKDQSKMLWFGPLIIGTKAKRFDLVRLVSERKQKYFICFRAIPFLSSNSRRYSTPRLAESESRLLNV